MPDSRSPLDSTDPSDSEAIGEVIARFEAELRRLAHGKMRNQPRSLLQTTALLNSACRRLIAASEETPPRWTDEAHFLHLAAAAMRSVLIDYARKRHSAKRHARPASRPVEELAAPGEHDFQASLLGVLAIDEGIEEQRTINAENADLAVLRYFGGLTVEETARAAGVGVNKVKLACAQLRRLLRKREEGREEE